jgi:DNA-binding LacI/PurR family transcriptional regulator
MTADVAKPRRPLASVTERPTMEDIARHVGVSKITVSRALRGDALVRSDTRERIVETARRLGYRFNMPARNFRQNRSRTVSVVVEMATSASGALADPYPLELLRGISQELTAAGYNLLLANLEDLDAPALQAAEGGILLGQGADDSALKVIGDSPVPWVVWGVDRPDHDHPTVGTDNLQGGELAAERFTALGRRRAVFLGDRHHAELAARAEGLTRGMARAGGAVVGSVACDFTFEGGVRAIDRLMDEGAAFDAVFAASDLIAMGAVFALYARGRHAPADVSVIGYDDTQAGATFVPPLTSVRQDWRRGGGLLARTVLDLIEGREARSATLPASLTIRAT